jgi:tRNA G18 (ribose-2'-O)-methylase SpoU
VRGYFEVGVYRPKTAENIGTLWRSAFQLGAAGIFTIGCRFPKRGSDTPKAWKHIPLRHYGDFEDFALHTPDSCELVGVEMGGKSLADFAHPERAIYLLGAEDDGLPQEIIARCNRLVSLDSVATNSYNVAVAGSIVAYSRIFGLGGRKANTPRLRIA